jgi:hypothetical protein
MIHMRENQGESATVTRHVLGYCSFLLPIYNWDMLLIRLKGYMGRQYWVWIRCLTTWVSLWKLVLLFFVYIRVQLSF